MCYGTVYYKGQISLSSGNLFVNNVGQYSSNQCGLFLPIPLIPNDFSSSQYVFVFSAKQSPGFRSRDCTVAACQL